MTDASQHSCHAGWQDARMSGAQPVADPFDPWTRPELYSGVLSRRTFAFLIDVVIITLPLVVVWFGIMLFGLITFGLGWHLFWILSPASAIWPVLYYGFTLGGPHSATPGMRMMGIEMRTAHGGRGYFVLGAAHALLFWASVSLLTPFVILIALFNRRRRLLHDMVLGTTVVNVDPLWR